VIKSFITQRLQERTTLDGVVLVGAGVVFLIFKPVAAIVAYLAIAYGVYTIVKSD